MMASSWKHYITVTISHSIMYACLAVRLLANIDVSAMKHHLDNVNRHTLSISE